MTTRCKCAGLMSYLRGALMRTLVRLAHPRAYLIFKAISSHLRPLAGRDDRARTAEYSRADRRLGWYRLEAGFGAGDGLVLVRAAALGRARRAGLARRVKRRARGCCHDDDQDR